MQENARRSAESAQSWNKTLAPGNATGDGAPRSTSSTAARSSVGGATAPSGPDCTASLPTGEPNPLIGAWRFAGTAVPMRGVIAMMVPLEDESACRRFLPESFEFTADALVVGGSRRPVTYARQGSTLLRGTSGASAATSACSSRQEGRKSARRPDCPVAANESVTRAIRAGPQAATTATTAPGLRFNQTYLCQGRRQVVISCGDSTDDASCAVQYPDELRDTRAGLLAIDRSARRGSLIERLKASSTR